MDLKNIEISKLASKLLEIGDSNEAEKNTLAEMQAKLSLDNQTIISLRDQKNDMSTQMAKILEEKKKIQAEIENLKKANS